MKKALMIGGGFAGCSMAHLLELKGGWDVTIVEASSFLGAGVRTSWWGGILIHSARATFSLKKKRSLNS